MKTKRETFVYHGLGFPVELIDCPMKEVFGEWVLDINLVALQRIVFHGLIHKMRPLSGKEMRFLRKFLGLSTSELAGKLGITHAAISKWESGQANVSPSQETYLRLLFCELFRDAELVRLFKEIRPEQLAKKSTGKSDTFQVHAKELEAGNF
jgi:transcriptional regulator with XRE-family HTH domain